MSICRGERPEWIATAGTARVDLVFHQGDERRDDDAQPLAGEGRNLIRERFPAARGHQRQRVAALQDGADDLQLHGTELREAPVAFQYVVYLVRWPFHEYKGRKN